ncbi:WD and tetratricopeptide repeats protein 1-like [Eurytemora carolleeae]|uniref:WD and tetratricopeptide repeats protein 1-like n=1 Tax=Eurytemora carolleeae TaxID=1294199 RepID=UPI000C7831F7|nr:WD and tetratricopeptide repeats protein 1-like [Eurytemora carolleeae]|eukprot:XP_023324321.1 WD and tetratricopeptide repeats protein 1-like [Eurytemora affinis]
MLINNVFLILTFFFYFIYVFQVLAGDNITVNCVQGHPGAPVLASSGIEAIIRLWHPLPENSTKESRNIQEMEKVVRENQNRMALDPFEFFMRTAEIRGEDEMQCRTS